MFHSIRVAIIGSNNMDLVTRAEKMPRVGETLEALSFSTGYGGKGANQAVAAAKLGAHVLMATKVGDDAFGNEYKKHLDDLGVDARHVRKVSGERNGVATIIVDGDGNNSILIVKGANN